MYVQNSMFIEFCQKVLLHLLRWLWDFFILQFVDVVYHTDWFADTEKSLLPWDKSHVIMVGLSCLLASSNRKESAHNAGDWGLIPGSGRSPGKGNDYPLRYSCLENLVDREEPGGLQSMGYSPWGCEEMDSTEWLERDGSFNVLLYSVW